MTSPPSPAPLPPPSFPWGLCIDQWQSADRPGASALLPTSPGGLLIEYHPVQAPLATHVAETAALSLVDALPHRAVEVQAIDFGIRKRFGHLAALAAHRLYRLYDKPEAARKALEAAEDLARHRHHALLDAATPTLSAFNERAAAGGQGLAAERYRVLMINLDDHPREDREVRAFELLMEAAFEAGLYLVAWRQQPDGATTPDTPSSSSASGGTGTGTEARTPVHAHALFDRLAQRLPLLRIDASGAMTVHGGGAETDALRQTAGALGLRLAPPQVDLAALLAHRLALATQGESQRQDFLSVPIGRTSDGRQEISLTLGARSDCHHGFMVGMSGSGKTTLLNNLIVGIAERYTSEELRLYLMDYKEGVEFQAFAEHPNCEQIFLDNADLGAARDLLQSFAHTIDGRGQRFRAAGVTGIAAWNALSEAMRPSGWERLPRLLLIVDEAQRLFTQDNTGRHFNELLKDVVKRGRSFGVHVLMSTQTLINANVDRDLMSQIGLRIACKVNNDIDCDRIVGYGNNAPRALARHEFILNPDSGQREANLQGRGLPPPQAAERLAAVRATRPAALCLTPQVVRSADQAGAPASPLPQTPGKQEGEPGTTPLPTWLTDRPDDSAQRAKQRAQEQLLAAFRAGQADLKPGSPPDYPASSPAEPPTEPTP